MQLDRTAILTAAAEEDAARLAAFRAGLHTLDTRALRSLLATNVRHLDAGTRDVWYGPRVKALRAELAKRPS